MGGTGALTALGVVWTGGSARAAARRTGIDYSYSRPDLAVVAASGASFVGRYFGGSSGKQLTASEAKRIIAAGMDIFCVWEKTANEALGGYSAGVAAAQGTAVRAADVGMPADRPVYFAVDFPATTADLPKINDFFDGVASVRGKDRVGVYGGRTAVAALLDSGRVRWAWQTLAWSNGKWDERAQIRQTKINVDLAGTQVDLNEAWADDFGQWGLKASVPAPIADEDMKLIQSDGRGIALVGAGYYRHVATDEEVYAAVRLVGPPVIGNDREFDVWRSIALQGVTS